MTPEEEKLVRRLIELRGHEVNCQFKGCTCGAVNRRETIAQRLLDLIGRQGEKP